MTKRFTAKLVARGPGGAWCFMPIPFDVLAAFGGKGRVPVRGSMNGFPFRSSLMPEGDGTHSMAINKALQAGALAQPGDSVEIELERDVAERSVAVPAELEAELCRSDAARAAFDKLSYSHRKEYADWVAAGKKPETRLERARKALEMVAAKRRFRESL
jgi:hypothetical protein